MHKTNHFMQTLAIPSFILTFARIQISQGHPFPETRRGFFVFGSRGGFFVAFFRELFMGHFPLGNKQDKSTKKTQKNQGNFLTKLHSPCRRRSLEKGVWRKSDGKGDRSVRKSDRKVTKTEKSDRTPFAALLLQHLDPLLKVS